MKPNHFLIPLIAILVAALSSRFTDLGVDSTWYTGLILPAFQPPAWVFGVVWTVLYILITISALMVWNTVERSRKWKEVITLFVLNAAINVTWTYVFFVNQYIEGALVELLLLNVTTLTLILVIWPQAVERKFLLFFRTLGKEQNEEWLKMASLLLVPYLAWGLFALALNYQIWVLNG